MYLCGRRGGFDKAYRKSFGPSTPAATPFVQGSPAVVEAQYGSPGVGTPETWAKSQMSPMVPGFGQSPPISPQPTGGYSQYGTGTMMSTDGSTLNTY